jgi:hypothetical protein
MRTYEVKYEEPSGTTTRASVMEVEAAGFTIDADWIAFSEDGSGNAVSAVAAFPRERVVSVAVRGA